MGIVAMIGLIFGPFVSLLFAAWFYVRWQNEEDEELALHNKKYASGHSSPPPFCWWYSAF